MPGPVIWSGHVVFGLVTVPVSLISAVEPRGTPLHWIHTAGGCNSRIRYRRYLSRYSSECTTEYEVMCTTAQATSVSRSMAWRRFLSR